MTIKMNKEENMKIQCKMDKVKEELLFQCIWDEWNLEKRENRKQLCY